MFYIRSLYLHAREFVIPVPRPVAQRPPPPRPASGCRTQSLANDERSERVSAKLREFQSEMEAWREISLGADFPA